MIITFNNKIIAPAANKWLELAPGVRVGNVYWSTDYLAIDDGGEGIQYVTEGWPYGGPWPPTYYYSQDAANRVAQTVGNGWRMPTRADLEALMAYGNEVGWAKFRTTYGWHLGRNGTDELGMHLMGLGYWWNGHGLEDSDACIPADSWYMLRISCDDWASMGTVPVPAHPNYWFPVRLVKDA